MPNFARAERGSDSVGKAAAGTVAQLVEVGLAGKVDHGGWSTHEHEGVLRGGCQVLLDHVGTHEARALSPVRSRPVQGEEEPQTVWVSLGHLFQLGTQQDVLFRLVSKNERAAGVVLWVVEHLPDDLENTHERV